MDRPGEAVLGDSKAARCPARRGMLIGDPASYAERLFDGTRTESAVVGGCVHLLRSCALDIVSRFILDRRILHDLGGGMGDCQFPPEASRAPIPAIRTQGSLSELRLRSSGNARSMSRVWQAAGSPADAAERVCGQALFGATTARARLRPVIGTTLPAPGT